MDVRSQKAESGHMLFTELHYNVNDHLLAGIEEIIGKHGSNSFYVSYWNEGS